MTKTLAKVKKARLISLSNGDKKTVLLENIPDRITLIQDKHVVCLDWITINGSYIVTAEEVDLSDQWVDSAMAYARSLKGWLKAVACERVRSYESRPWNGKMPLGSLQSRIESFIKKWKQEMDYQKRYNLFLANGGDPDDLQ